MAEESLGLSGTSLNREMAYVLENPSNAGITNGLVAAKAVILKSPSFYTWLDKLRFLKGYHKVPKYHLAESLSSFTLDDLSAQKNRGHEDFECEMLSDHSVTRRYTCPVSRRNSERSTEEVVSWGTDKSSPVFAIALQPRGLGSSAIKAKSCVAEPVVWSIRRSTNKLRCRVPCSLDSDHDAVPASTCNEYDACSEVVTSEQVNRIVEELPVKETGLLDPEEVFQYFEDDVFGMDDRRIMVLSSRKRFSRKAKKLLFLPKSTEQIAEEVKYTMSQRYLVSVDAESTWPNDGEFKQCRSDMRQQRMSESYLGLTAKPDTGIYPSNCTGVWMFPPVPSIPSQGGLLGSGSLSTMSPPCDCVLQGSKKRNFRTTRPTGLDSDGKNKLPAAGKRQAQPDPLVTQVSSTCFLLAMRYIIFLSTPSIS